MAHNQSLNGLTKAIHRPGFWLVLAMLAAISIPYYVNALGHSPFIYHLMSALNLGQDSFERVLYLAPIVWAGFIFGWKGAFVTSLAALALMLPRAAFFSEYPKDALLETSAVFIISNVLAVSFTSLYRLPKAFSRPGFWLVLAMLVAISIPHYIAALGHPPFIGDIMSALNLGRGSFERVLYLAPIVWAGFIFGWKGAFITSLATLALMLPRAIFFSEYPINAILETSAVFIISNVLAISFASLRHEREYGKRLEAAHQELQSSEERYRQLFENALDAIWLHDLKGNIIAANKSTEKLSGYSVEKLTKMNVRTLLTEESLNLADQVRRRLLASEPVEQPYEQHLIRQDGSEIFVQLATSLVFGKGGPVAVQHIARDVTEEKRMQENLRFYIRQATRAQEEERKRISHELHDDTIQALVVLSRQLDSIASHDTGLSEENRHRLEELWQQTDNILKGVRRLSQDLRPAALDRLGLLPALEWLASSVMEYSGIATRVNVVGEERPLPEEVTIALFRITQEALRNVWRHSGATTAEITVEFGKTRTRITINDNGRGFQIPQKVGDLAKEGKLGLAGMQERAQLIGGILTVQSQPGKGSSITVETSD